MNTTAQQLPSNPALDFAQSILEETNNALELIEILSDIAEGNDENATTNDRIAATNVLTDRGLGKCPRQITPNIEPRPETDDSDVEPAPYSIRGAIRESPPAKPESPRLVTRIDESLNRSLGPAPSASQHTPQTPDSFDPNSIHFTIQQHILAITNNGQTLRDTLLEIARAKDDPKVRPYHRRRAATLLMDRVLGTDPALIRNGVCPDCRQRWTTHTSSPDHPEQSSVVAQVEEEPIDKEAWDRVIVELKEMEKRYNLDPNRSIPRNDYSHYLPPDDFDLTPYLHEADAFRAKIALQAERRKNWPEIEERRRKKLAQIYPSHSEGDDGSPDT